MTALIPQIFIDQLLQQTDLVELIDYYVPLKKQGNNYTSCCPFHQEKSASFYVVANKQFYHCFGCGVSGNAISFLMQYLSIGFIPAIETLAAKLGVAVVRSEDQHNRGQQKAALNLYQLLSRVNKFYQDLLATQGQAAQRYLEKRGINKDMVKFYELGYAPQGWETLKHRFKLYIAQLLTTGMLITHEDNHQTYDRYRNRLIFPIHNRKGQIVGFGGRALTAAQKPKYLNSPETIIFQKNRELYGLYQVLQIANQATVDHIIIVEGYIDVISLAQHGITNVVATLGTATSGYHIKLLTKYTSLIYFCFDGDVAGRKAAWRALESCLAILNYGLEVKFIFLPEGEDPDSLVKQQGVEEFNKYLIQAKSLPQFFFNSLLAEINLNNFAGKSQLINAAKPYLSKIGEGAYKQLLLDELALLTNIEGYRLQQLLVNLPEKNNELVQQVQRTPINLAIAILLQHPEIYTHCKPPINLELLDEINHRLLKEVLLTVAKSAGKNTAALIENWRNSVDFAQLCSLAAWDHNVSIQSLATEFSDIVLFLQKKNLENKINTYLTKSKQQGLTTVEQIMLQNLLRDKIKGMSKI